MNDNSREQLKKLRKDGDKLRLVLLKLKLFIELDNESKEIQRHKSLRGNI